LSPETCKADSNRAIKRSIKENFCVLLVAYIVVLMMHGITNVKYRLTVWPWSWTFTVQHTINVKCEYFMNQEG
jgi:hypothetical protein